MKVHRLLLSLAALAVLFAGPAAAQDKVKLRIGTHVVDQCPPLHAEEARHSEEHGQDL